MTALAFGSTGGIGAAFRRALAEHNGVELVVAGRTAPGGAERFLPVDLEDPRTMSALAETRVAAASSPRPDRQRHPARRRHHGSQRRSSPISTPRHSLAPSPSTPPARSCSSSTSSRSFLAAAGSSLRLSQRASAVSKTTVSGGWYSYRASKAALNQGLRCAAIELKRTHRESVCVALHPGTVDTALSEPFQARSAGWTAARIRRRGRFSSRRALDPGSRRLGSASSPGTASRLPW